jgi:hypothetical protein
MSKYIVAKSFQSAERIGEPFDKNGKLYTKIKEICPRCGGLGIIVSRVENGQPIPIPVDGGICYECQGARFLYKEVRLYTEAELATMERNAERARQKKAEEQKKKMEAEFAENERKWKAQNGWSEDGITYVVTGNSYSIKDELKQNGFRYDPILRWHKATKDEKYADRLIEIKLDDVVEISAWGKGHYKTNAKDIVDKALAATQPESTSTWIGEVGEKIKDIKVQLVRKYTTETRYGLNTLYSFQTEEGNILVWFSSTIQTCEVGDWMKIKYGTIKKLDTFNGIKQTVLTRCKLIY